MTNRNILVVGAGFAGAVYARELADVGYKVFIIDKRNHVAGNAYDEKFRDGTRVHRYGPHILHTSNAAVIEWIKRFETFEPYEHHVLADIGDSRVVPLPVNQTTINEVFSLKLSTEEEVRTFLVSVAEPIGSPTNAAEYLYSKIGRTLTDLFFRPYTRKMWGLDLEDTHESVVRRIPIRFDDDSRYFPNDAYQFMPKRGYTALVESILDHHNISVSVGLAYERGMEQGYAACFNSMPIDEYFDFTYGVLPYRSVKFHHRTEPISYSKGAPVINFTDTGLFTRETNWSDFPLHHDSTGITKTVTKEEPCDYTDNNLERYYPVRTSDDRYKVVYGKYQELAKRSPSMIFIGRCGTYQYLDMDQVINQSLSGVRRWLSPR